MIVGRFVGAYRAPVDCFRRHGRVRMSLDHSFVNPFSVGKFLLHESQPGHGHFQTRTKPLFWQIAFDPVALLSVGIRYQDGRCPESVEAFEPRGMFFDMGFERDESLMNKVCDFLIRI